MLPMQDAYSPAKKRPKRTYIPHHVHIVLKYNEYGWWRYFQDYVHQLEGWVGNDLEIIGEPKLIEEITEE